MIKGLLLDSGRVVNYSSSGHWFITPNFFNYIDKLSFDKLSKKQVKDAFLMGLKYIDKQRVILDKEVEYKHFVKCYRIFLDELPMLKTDNLQAEHLAKDLVYNPKKYVFYDDAKPLLEVIKNDYKLAVVSDAWPSLRDVFIEADCYKYFDSFVISSEIGVCKPNAMMYCQAMTDLELKTEEVVFVDDRPKNCQGALNLGIKSYLLCRHWSNYIIYKLKYRQFSVIKNLKQLQKEL